jgi:NAD-dependent dihydropyrimidine dehydrogenase PreA subunit
MAMRSIVKIDEDLCDGCGECVPACAEGAIQLIDGKAKLVSDNLCDGLGACLGDCPQGAITIEQRQADAFDEAAVEQHLKQMEPESPSACGCPDEYQIVQQANQPVMGGGCPGAKMMHFNPAAEPPEVSADRPAPSRLTQWPVQLHLVPPTAPYFQGADVVLAADCTAYAVGDFHERFLKGKALAVACPKLDQGLDVYLDKLVAMIDQAQINTLQVLIMEVPCCGGLVQLAKQAVEKAQRKVPIKLTRIGIRGDVLDENWMLPEFENKRR